MCLKKFLILTFSNREAYERAKTDLESNYGTKMATGTIYVIKRYKTQKIKQINATFVRNDSPYKLLKKLYCQNLLNTETYHFCNWQNYLTTINLIKNKQDLFGKFIVELQ